MFDLKQAQQAGRDMIRHAAEVARAVRRHKWTQVANGIHLDEMRAVAGGTYVISVRRKGRGPLIPLEVCPNLLPTEGLAAILNVLGGNIAVPTLYLALFNNSYTPTASDTGAGFTATYGEITSTTEGFSGSNRITWTDATTTTTAINNYASPGVFTMVSVSTSTIVVRGAAMLTTQARGNTTGKLISAARFGSDRVFSDTDELDLKYQLSLTPS